MTTKRSISPLTLAQRAMAGRRQSGVTMIEILITLLILSVGLLGLAALQGFSMQAGQISYYRTQATNVAYEVADFARANRSIASQGVLENLGQRLAAERLPSGNATVQWDGTIEEVTVTVSWLDDREEAADASFTITTRV